MFRYFARIERGKLVLWCYLAWYVAIMSRYLDPSPMLWISSLGISAFIGFALNLATRLSNIRHNPWVVFRLFLIPFCVSSYSATIKGKGFVLLFPSDPPSLLAGIAACAGMLLFWGACYLLFPGERLRKKKLRVLR